MRMEDYYAKTVEVTVPPDSNYVLSDLSYENNSLIQNQDYTVVSQNDGSKLIYQIAFQDTDHVKIGAYTVTFTDDKYEDISTTFELKADMAAEDVQFVDNKLVIHSDVVDVQTYINAISSISVNGSEIRGAKGSSLFDEEGNVLLDAEASFHGSTTVFFPEEGTYTIAIKSTGYPDLTGTVTVGTDAVKEQNSESALEEADTDTQTSPQTGDTVPVVPITLAAVLVLAHNCIYGRNYFKLLFTRPAALPVNQLAAAVVSLFLITDMVVLTITSFPQIRKKMKAKNWKKLQRTAYMFYGFIYIHILLIHIPLARRGIQASLWNVFVYSIVFISYAVLRIRKYILMKNKAKISENPQFARHTNFLSGVAGVVLFLAVFLPTAIGNATQTKAAAKKNTVAVQKTTNETITETTKETAGTQQMAETGTDSQENNEDTAQEEDTVQSDELETEQNTEPEGSSTPKDLETEKETINEAKEEESTAVQPIPAMLFFRHLTVQSTLQSKENEAQ